MGGARSCAQHMVILLTFSRSYDSSELHTHEVLDGHACVVVERKVSYC